MNFPDWLYELAEFEIDKKAESSPPVLVKLKPAHPCDDCGATLDKIRVVEQTPRRTPYPHVSKRCKYCGLYEHPKQPGVYISNAEYRSIINAK